MIAYKNEEVQTYFKYCIQTIQNNLEFSLKHIHACSNALRFFSYCIECV